MVKRTFALLCLLGLLTPAAMADNPTLNISPPSATLPPGSTQLFTATFSDGSHIRQCTWNATGVPPNSITPVGATANSAVFGAGTTPGQYVVTAVCANSAGVTAVGSAPVTITQN
jgi:hypothetical protein